MGGVEATFAFVVIVWFFVGAYNFLRYGYADYNQGQSETLYQCKKCNKTGKITMKTSGVDVDGNTSNNLEISMNCNVCKGRGHYFK